MKEAIYHLKLVEQALIRAYEEKPTAKRLRLLEATNYLVYDLCELDRHEAQFQPPVPILQVDDQGQVLRFSGS